MSVLAALGVVMTLAALFVVPESLAPEKRHTGGLQEFGRAARAVLSNRRYVGYVVVASSSFIGLFAYVATSAFISSPRVNSLPTSRASFGPPLALRAVTGRPRAPAAPGRRTRR